MLAKRAERALIVGVEVDNRVVQTLIPSIDIRFHGAAGYLIERTDINQQRSKADIKAAVQTAQDVENILDENEVTQFAGNASSVTGMMQILLAMEYAAVQTPRTLIKNRSNWRITC
jgi:hypothetical protein